MSKRSEPMMLMPPRTILIKQFRPRVATDPEALALDLKAGIAAAHTTADDRVVALGLDLAPQAGSAYALIEPGRTYDSRLDFAALGRLDLLGGNWDTGAAIFVRLRAFLQVLRPGVIFYRADRPDGRDPRPHQLRRRRGQAEGRRRDPRRPGADADRLGDAVLRALPDLRGRRPEAAVHQPGRRQQGRPRRRLQRGIRGGPG